MYQKITDPMVIQTLTDRARNIKHNANRMIWVTFQKVGFHKYPQALTDETLADVSYLGQKHLHFFKFKVAIEIFHNDRELEFHQFLNFCESQYSDKTLEVDFKSVEMIADDLYDVLALQFPNRKIIIDVSEDGECGCSIEYNL